MDLLFITLGKSFLCMRRSKVPRIEPFPPHYQFLIQLISISLVKLHVVFSVVNFALNPYCSFVKILYFIK